jgi:hypothetical protein
VMAAILLVISLAAFAQFAIYYWRATIAIMPKAPVSDRLRAAAGISATSVSSSDFRAILNVHDFVREMGLPGRKFRTVRSYYRAVEMLKGLLPSIARWADAEMTMCTQYVATLVDQQLESNVACAAHMRGM